MFIRGLVKIMLKEELEIYIHIPFCKKKCAYCDFLSFPEYQESYIPALQKEIENIHLEGKKVSDYKVKTIFIGGGTPSILKEKESTAILEAVYKRFDVEKEAEITIEANPGTLTKEKLASYRAVGINRISMGLQSTENKELKELGRIHTYEEFLNNYQLAREVGFTNINIDLMSAIPHQTTDSWKETLYKIIDLNPEHISAYSLIVEEGTDFYDKFQNNVLELPTEEEERQMYYDTKKIVSEAGYHRYEISNYSKKGYECKHNIGYWKRTDYIGFGLGASSLIQNKRFTNEINMKRYLQEVENNTMSLHQKIQSLTLTEQMEEFMFLGLRLIEGISKKEFKNQFDKEYEAVYGICSDQLINQGLLKADGDYVCLTERGLDVSNHVMAEFLL